MILSKHGIKRRIAALLAALLIFGTSVMQYPARAAAALPVVGAAVTLSAFLMASGIYPFIDGSSAEELDFDDWSNEKLKELWNQYQVQAEVQPPNFDKISALLSGASIIIANELWKELINFVQWIKTKFSIENNREGVQIGESGYGKTLPIMDNPSVSQLVSSGMTFPGTGDVYYAITDMEYPAGYIAVNTWPDSYLYLCFFIPQKYVNGSYLSGSNCLYSAKRTSTNVTKNTYLSGHSVVDGVNVDYFRVTQVDINYKQQYIDMGIPYFDSVSALQSHFATLQSETMPSFPGVTADTTTVAPPAALPENAQFGGLAIPAAGTVPTVETLENVIEQGVTERQKPQVVPVEVTVTGVDVDTETGTIVENPVAVTPEAVPQVATDYTVPGLHTVFPFSIPWDIYNVFAALNAPPQRPYWDVSLTIPALFTGGESVQVPFTIGVKDDDPLAATMDATAAKIRAFLLVLMCVATLVLFFRR